MTPELRGQGQRHELVIVGMRPEHFEDASLVDAARRGRASRSQPRVDVTEWLGNEQYAYIPFETDPDVQAKLDELDRDLDGEGMRTPDGRGARRR